MWAAGCMLFELLAGRKLFQPAGCGDDASKDKDWGHLVWIEALRCSASHSWKKARNSSGKGFAAFITAPPR